MQNYGNHIVPALNQLKEVVLSSNIICILQKEHNINNHVMTYLSYAISEGKKSFCAVSASELVILDKNSSKMSKKRKNVASTKHTDRVNTGIDAMCCGYMLDITKTFNVNTATSIYPNILQRFVEKMEAEGISVAIFVV